MLKTYGMSAVSEDPDWVVLPQRRRRPANSDGASGCRSGEVAGGRRSGPLTPALLLRPPRASDLVLGHPALG